MANKIKDDKTIKQGQLLGLLIRWEVPVCVCPEHKYIPHSPIFYERGAGDKNKILCLTFWLFKNKYIAIYIISKVVFQPPWLGNTMLKIMKWSMVRDLAHHRVLFRTPNVRRVRTSFTTLYKGVVLFHLITPPYIHACCLTGGAR